jgi:hypothetical protein
MFRNVLNAVRTSRRPTPRKVCLRVEGLEERTCPATIQRCAAALGREILAASRQFVLDAATVEEHSPTAMADTVNSDLVELFQDAGAHQVMDVFHDLQQLGQDLRAEASYVREHQLPREDALWYSLRTDCHLASDVARLARDQERYVQLLLQALRAEFSWNLPGHLPRSGFGGAHVGTGCGGSTTSDPDLPPSEGEDSGALGQNNSSVPYTVSGFGWLGCRKSDFFSTP